MTRKPLPEPPAALTAAQADLWRGLLVGYRREYGPGGLTADDMLALQAVVDVAGRLWAVGRQIDADGLMLGGSMGQQRANPLLSIEAALRAELAGALLRWRGR